MNFQRSPIGNAAALSLLGLLGAAHAQTPTNAPAQKTAPSPATEIVVTGIRGSIEKCRRFRLR